MSPELQVRALLQPLARHLKEDVLPPGWGCAVFAFPLEGREGNWNYVSTAKRADVMRNLEALLAKWRAEGLNPEPTTLGEEETGLEKP